MNGTPRQRPEFATADEDPLGNMTADPADTKPRRAFVPLWRLGNLLCWLGGASWRDIGDRHERALYQMSGCFVLGVGVIAWGVASLAAVGVLEVPITKALPYAIAWGLFVGGFDRTISSKVHDPSEGRFKRSSGYLVRGLFAVLIGLAIAETAALVVFADPIRRTMQDNIQEQIDKSRRIIFGEGGKPSSRSAELADLQRQRDDLLRAVDNAQSDLELKRYIAECERRPDGCPREMVENGTISGVAGEGEKTRIRDAEATAAADVLTQATARRNAEVPGLNTRIATLTDDLTRDSTDAQILAEAERGFDARWRAMHEYTTSSPSALSIRVTLALILVIVDLIPLLLKLLRGMTMYDARILTRRRRTIAALDMHSALHHNRLGALAERQRVHNDAELKRSKIVTDTDVRLEEQRQQIRFEFESEALRANWFDGEPAHHDGVNLGNESEDHGDEPTFEGKIPRWWTPEDRQLIGKVFGGRFLAKAPLVGADIGSFGRVLVGIDYHDGSRVVIKAVPEPVETVWRLTRRNPHRRMWELEVESATKLRHPNIGELIGSGIEHGYMWTVSPLYEPGSLVRWIDSKEHRGYPLRLNDILKIVDQLVDALVYAHIRNLSHGDIKPSNLVLDGIQLMLVDWGLARAVGQATHSAHPTRPLGTRYYTAPEVFSALDDGYSTELADIYSVGATWYFLLVGESPFQRGSNRLDCIPLIRLLPDLPVEITDLVHRLISRIPDDRMHNWSGAPPAVELQREIRQLIRTLDHRGLLDLAVGSLAVEEHYHRYNGHAVDDSPDSHGHRGAQKGAPDEDTHDPGDGGNQHRKDHTHGPRETTLAEQEAGHAEPAASRMAGAARQAARHQPTAPDPTDVVPATEFELSRRQHNGLGDVLTLFPEQNNGHHDPTSHSDEIKDANGARGGTPTDAEPHDLDQP
jgi:Domain of unknown function (DUF4407)/Protein kinase domain